MIRWLALWVAWPGLAVAQVLTLPGNAALQQEVVSDLDSYVLPVAPWDGSSVPGQTVEGAMTTQIWRIPAAGLASLQLLRPLRDQLRQAGYDVVFDCDTDQCGGFDFRFGTPIAAPPAMQVDLADFRFVSATRSDDDGLRAVSLLVSRTPQAGFVQIIRVVPTSAVDVPQLTASDAPVVRATAPVATGDLARSLTDMGHAVLTGVTFDSGSVTLGAGEQPALAALAKYMSDNPDLQVSIVGHTDSSGGLDGNIAISRRRAAAVVDRLVSDHGIARARLEAAGMGYMSPIASNLTPTGRDANRRVAAVVTGPIPAVPTD